MLRPRSFLQQVSAGRSARRAARALACAAALALVLLIGYLLASAGLIAWLVTSESGNLASRVAAPNASELLLYRYRFTGDLKHSPWAPLLPSALSLFFGALVGVFAGRYAPAAFAAGRLRNTDTCSSNQARRLWRVSVRTGPLYPSLRVLIVGFFAGILGGVIGGAEALFRMHTRIEAAWMTGSPQSAIPPRPHLGWFAMADGCWMIAASVTIGLWMLLTSVQRALQHRWAFARLCHACGYPRDRFAPKHQTEKRCPECGQTFDPKRSRQRRR